MRKPKDTRWHIKSIAEIVLILIFIVCLIGFLASWVVMIWNKEIAGHIIGFSVVIGIFNLLVIVSCDKDWRKDYE